MNYSWHESQWQQFLKQRQKGRLPHALLLYGPAGLGKKQFALRIAQALLCKLFNQSHVQQHCEQCQACHWFKIGNHPDFFLLEPHHQDNKNIGIGQIRELIIQLPLTPHSAHYKIFIIHPASAMTQAACNALLKSLEEPPASQTLWILITESMALLPATLVSRCQRMRFSMPPFPIPAEGSKQIAQLYADLNDLFAQTTHPILLARQWQKMPLLTLLNALLIWIYLQIKQQMNNPLLCQRLFNFIDEVYEIKHVCLQKVALNQLLLLESLFIKSQEIAHGRGKS